MIHASMHGFLPENSPSGNRIAMQNLLDQGGTIVVDRPGVYDIDDALQIGSYTTLIFENGAAIRKVPANGNFAYAIVNKGAFTKSWDEHIVVRGMKILVNNVAGNTPVPGLRGQMAFHYVRDLLLDDIRIPDLEPAQFGIHICTFEDIQVKNCIITGKKDGVHLGRGRRFTISNCVFDTFDDAVALNAHDYDSSNPELGWIEDGIIEKCWDVNPEHAVGFFCRILAGAWIDWYEGMQVQKSDTVVSDGRLYRVFADPDGTKYTSVTRPAFEKGRQVLDGITWQMVQEDVTYEAGVRNVTFRDIWLQKPRTAFSVHFDHDVWSRSFYPGAENPLQENICFENVRVQYDNPSCAFIHAVTPIDSMTLTNCSLRGNPIVFRNPANLENPGDTRLTLNGCSDTSGEVKALIRNRVEGKTIHVSIDGEKYDC